MLGSLFALLNAGVDPQLDVKADELLREVRTYVASRSYPERLSFRVVVTLRDGVGKASFRTYDSAYDGDSDVVYTHSLSEEEGAKPFRPTGINLVVGLSASTSTGSTGSAVQVNRPADDRDVIGIPMLSPTYTFGLGQEAPVAAYSAPAPYPVIAITSTVNRIYSAAFVANEVINGEVCAHLRLSPAHDPGRYRLRDVWVASDGAPLQLTTHGNFSSRPWDGIDWKVTYRREGTALYLDTEETEESVRVDRYRRGHVLVSFTDIAPSDHQKSFLFSVEPNNAVREP